MLQLPTPTPRRQFSKPEIVEISRGAKTTPQRRGPQTDPVIALVARADAALNQYIECKIGKWEVEQKMDRHDIFPAKIGISDEMLHVFWQRGDTFHSEDHIEREFKRAERVLRKQAREYRSALLKLKSKKGVDQLQYERSQGLAAVTAKLRLLPSFMAPMKNAFRKEDRRIKALHRRTGLDRVQARTALATKELAMVTRAIKTATPKTREGALAIAGYVEKRLHCDKPGLFMEDGYFPSSLGHLLRRSLAFLQKAPGR